MRIDLRLGDCLEVLKTIPDNSIDSVVTDPPYGLSFMGKKWDYDVPSVEVWTECLRVLKPGGHLLSFAGSRTYHRMAVRIEDAGFEIRDQLMWVFGSGFPKSHNIGKAIDKKQGIISHSILELKQIIIDYFNQSGLKKNEFDKLCNFRAANYMRTESREDDGWGEAIPSNEKWIKIKEVLNIDTDEYDELFQSAVRDVVGRGSSGIGKAFTKEGWHSETMEFDITEAKNQEAKNWEGWGTALKPAHEPIVMARKPLSEKSIAENVLKHGTGGINIDGSRIEIGDEKVPRLNVAYEHKANNNFGGGDDGRFGTTTMSQDGVSGRFPANIIFDEEAGQLLDEQSGKSKTKANKNYKHSNTETESNTFTGRGNYTPREDEGGASRFFYCPKAAKKDRNEGLDDFEDRPSQLNSGGIGRKVSVEKRLQENGENVPTMKNNHPTVKPTDLMRYLINLITPPNGTILDPFMGSGSTGKAAVRCGVNFIGIEKEQEYMDIASARIEHERNKPTQTKLF